MASNVTIRLNNSPLLALVKQLPLKAQENTDDAAESLRRLAVMMAPRDTGSLQASIYVSGPQSSDYMQCAGAAEDLNDRAVIVPEVTPGFAISLWGMVGSTATKSVVGVAVEHGIFQELGTRYMSAQPFMLPASEVTRNYFTDLMSKIADF